MQKKNSVRSLIKGLSTEPYTVHITEEEMLLLLESLEFCIGVIIDCRERARGERERERKRGRQREQETLPKAIKPSSHGD